MELCALQSTTLLLLSDLMGLPNPVYRRVVEPVKNGLGRPVRQTHEQNC